MQYTSAYYNKPRLPGALLAFCLCLLFILPAPGEAAVPPTHKEQSGKLPQSGTVALRSGLEWMDETHDIFLEFIHLLQPLLDMKGLTVLEVPPSSLIALPPGVSAPKGSALEALGESPAQTKGRQTPVPPQTIFFARSQVAGQPHMLRGGRIPGHLPVEVLADDPFVVDYVIVSRFAAVSPSFGGLSWEESPEDFITAAAPVKGVGSLGYGRPAKAAPPRSSYGNTPGDYNRGYEGNSPIPGDPWNREGDLRARDYQLRHGPAPESAAPPASTGRVRPAGPGVPHTPSLPKAPLPGDTDMPAVTPGPSVGPGTAPPPKVSDPLPFEPTSQVRRRAVSPAQPPAVAGYALEMECYDVRPTQKGKKPVVVWACTVQQRADRPSLVAALPSMLRAAMGGKAI